MILLLLSFLRTVVPAIVGAIITELVKLGLTVDPEFEGLLTGVLFATFTGLYYLIVRVIEMKFPLVGILIGWAKSPDSYSRGAGVDIVAKNETQALVEASHISELNSSVVSNLDRVPGPDHRAE